MALTEEDDCLDGLPPERVRHTDDTALCNRGMFHQHIFHLIGADPVAAGLDDVVKSAVEPIAAIFVHICRIAGVIHTAAPYIAILGFVIQISGKYAGLPPFSGGMMTTSPISPTCAGSPRLLRSSIL